MRKVMYLFMSVLALGSLISCSEDDEGDSADDGSGITGKWYYYQMGIMIDGTEHLSDYLNDCGENYIELKSNGDLKEVWYYNEGSGCEAETSESGRWVKNGNEFTISYDEEIYIQGEIVTLNDSTLKIRYVESGNTNIMVFKRSLNGIDDDDDVSAFAGNYSGNFTGDDNGNFSVTISSSGAINGSGYSTNWDESFSLSGSVSSNGSFNAGNASTGATFSGTISGNSMSGSWDNPATGESGSFTGTKQ